MKLVSVIMPVYNAEKYVYRAIESILAQSYKNIELLISDDGSTDNSISIIDSFKDSRIKTFHNDKNIGSLLTRNNLVEKVTGEYIAWQDADDRSHPNRIEKLVYFLDNNPEIALCGCNFVRNFSFWKRQSISSYPVNHDEIIQSIIYKEFIPFCAPSTILRTSVFRELGGFRGFFNGLGWYDFDLILRLSERYKVANIPDILYEYQYVKTSLSRQSSNFSIQKAFINDMGMFLGKQRSEFKADALMNEKYMEQFEKFILSLESIMKEDPSYLIRRRFKNYLSNLDYIPAISAATIALKMNKFHFKNYKAFWDIALSLAKNLLILPYNYMKVDKYKWPS